MDAVLPGDAQGRAVGRRSVADERPQARVRADEVGPGQVDVERAVHGGEDLVHVVGRRHDPVGRSLVGQVGRADEPVAGPRDEEHDLAGDPDGQPGGRRDPVAADDEVRPPARTDVRRRRSLDRERAVRQAGPDAGGVDHRPGADDEVRPAELVADVRTGDPARSREGAVDAQAGRDGRARARAVRATASAKRASSSTPSWNTKAPRSRGRRRTGVCSSAASTPRYEAPAVPRGAEQVVQRQAGAVERADRDRVPVEREEERLQADEVRRDAQEPAALRERLADESEPQLLEVAEPAVDSRLDRLEVPAAMSSRSMQATRRSRLTPSSAAPAPVTPPPTMRRSSVVRQAGEVGAAPVQRPACFARRALHASVTPAGGAWRAEP